MAQPADIAPAARLPEAPGTPRPPARVPRRSWREIARRTARGFQEDNLTDWAAALTYYAVLALFPGLIVLVALLGVFGRFPETFVALLDIVRQVGPDSAVEAFEGPIASVIAEKQTAGALLGLGIAAALWSASGYVGAFMRASNAIYDVEESRPFWRLRPLQVGVTVVMVVILALVAIALVVTGPVAEAVGGVIGLGDLAVTVWSVAKWPVLLLVVMATFAVLYHVAPDVPRPRFRWFTTGAALALLVWVLASALFGAYVANFGSYDKTYGALGGVILFLTWLWIGNIAILLGAEIDAQVDRQRELGAGPRAEEEPSLPPREHAKP